MGCLKITVSAPMAPSTGTGMWRELTQWQLHRYLCQESMQTLSNKEEINKSLKFVLLLVVLRKDDSWLGVCYY